MEKLEIPKELLSEFKNTPPGGLPGSEADSQSGSGTAVPGSSVGIQSLEKSLHWLTKAGDAMAKEKGYPGLGKMNSEDFAELLSIVAERNLTPGMLEKSPEIMLGSVCIGILAENMLHNAQVRKQSKEDKETGSNE